MLHWHLAAARVPPQLPSAPCRAPSTRLGSLTVPSAAAQPLAVHAHTRDENSSGGRAGTSCAGPLGTPGPCLRGQDRPQRYPRRRRRARRAGRRCHAVRAYVRAPACWEGYGGTPTAAMVQEAPLKIYARGVVQLYM
jgi:hypothetical protein